MIHFRTFIAVLCLSFPLIAGCDADDWEEVGKADVHCQENQVDEKEACKQFLEAEDVYVNQACKMMSVNPEVFCEMRWHCIADEPKCYMKSAIQRCVDAFPSAVCSDSWQNTYPEPCNGILEAAPSCTVGQSTIQ